jgi:hypothetical protein
MKKYYKHDEFKKGQNYYQIKEDKIVLGCTLNTKSGEIPANEIDNKSDTLILRHYREWETKPREASLKKKIDNFLENAKPSQVDVYIRESKRITDWEKIIIKDVKYIIDNDSWELKFERIEE